MPENGEMSYEKAKKVGREIIQDALYEIEGASLLYKVLIILFVKLALLGHRNNYLGWLLAIPVGFLEFLTEYMENRMMIESLRETNFSNMVLLGWDDDDNDG